MRFEWNERKARANKAKHGVSFAEAARFEFETANIFEDDSDDYGEDRLIGIGFLGNRIHYIVYTMREGNVRVISLRPATKAEAEDYVRYVEEGI